MVMAVSINAISVHTNVTRKTDFKNMLMESMEKRKTLNVINVTFLQAGEEVTYQILNCIYKHFSMQNY
jgi:hypothetical protein